MDEESPRPKPGPVELPEPERRQWLLESLRALLQRTEWEQFVCSPIVLPRPEYFPDRWTPTTGGVARLLRRLFCFADLEELTPRVELFDEERPPERHGVTSSVHHKGTAGLFLGIEDDVAYFGAESTLLADPGGITATLAHEVAHAYRTHRELCVADVDVEEQLTDLTTVFLGFGILNANASLRHRSGFGEQGIFTHEWTVQRLGYLPPQELCFLLAAQVHVRGPERADARAIAAQLELNQAGFFRAALRWLARERPQLARELGLPPAESWPPPDSLAKLTRPLAEGEEPEEEVPAPAPAPPVRFNVGRPVFRVWRRPRRETFIIDMLLVLAAVLTLASDAIVTTKIAVAAVAVAGLVLTGRRLRPCCSDPGCRVALSRSAKTCPGCGGTVSGELQYASERLAAEEALRPAGISTRSRTGRPAR